MCTVTWIRDDDGYELLFNRDENRKRKKAAPPSLAARDGVRFLAPIDGDFGGTWIATNELGMSVCLLNGANLTRSSAPGVDRPRSRGHLVPELISSPTVAAVCERIDERVREAGLSMFAPFTIAAIAPSQPAALIEWNGSQATFRFDDQACFMLTSSSFDTEKVRNSRQQEYHQVTSPTCDAESLAAFHHSHGPSRSAYSPCMHRPDAKTVSFSRIRVTSREADFFYSPAAPCERAPGTHLKLARSGSASGASLGSPA